MESRQCILYDRVCQDCGECRCDLDPEKICDNCMQCVTGGAEWRAVSITRFDLQEEEEGEERKQP